MNNDFIFSHIIGTNNAIITNNNKVIKIRCKEKINEYLNKIDDYGTEKSSIRNGDFVIIRPINNELKITNKSDCYLVNSYQILKDKTIMPNLKNWFIELENILIKNNIYLIEICIENKKLIVLNLRGSKLKFPTTFNDEIYKIYNKYNKIIENGIYSFNLLLENVYKNK